MTIGMSSQALNISVVGAGLGGLAAAIALRKRGHQVQVFETSSLNKEIGLGIGIPPNGAHVLEDLGYRCANLRSIELDGSTVFSSEGNLTKDTQFGDLRIAFGQSWALCHRVDLHEELRRLALDEEGFGCPVVLHLSSVVSSCDPGSGTLVLKDGRTFEADLIIGADGIRSTIRTSILGYTVEAPPSGMCAFRWVTEASKVQNVEKLNWVLNEGPHHLKMVTSQDRMILTYPIRDETLINGVAMCLDTRDQTNTRWNTTVSKSILQDRFKDHHPNFIAFLDLADDEVLLYQLRALPPLPTWTNGVACLLGDAAHALHPASGQGAAIAFEDAATLGVLLPLGVTKEQVPARLMAYQQLRKGRAERLTAFSIQEAKTLHMRGLQTMPIEVQKLIFGHNATEVAQNYYNEHFRDACFL